MRFISVTVMQATNLAYKTLIAAIVFFQHYYNYCLSNNFPTFGF